jgi:hypothetical protein
VALWSHSGVRVGCSIALAVLAIAGALVVADPWIPTTVRFSSADQDAMVEYKRLVEAHGYRYKESTSATGERFVEIERISSREYLPIDCAFWRWDSARATSKGIYVSERDECAL